MENINLRVRKKKKALPKEKLKYYRAIMELTSKVTMTEIFKAYGMGTSMCFTLNTVEGRSKINRFTLSHFKKTA